MVHNPYFRDSIGNNSDSIKRRAVKFACSIVFSDTADCDRRLCHVTGSEHA